MSLVCDTTARYFSEFLFSSRRRHTSYIGDWSSDVCSSDLCSGIGAAAATTPADAGKLCSDTVGPLLNLLQMNYPPLSVDPLNRQGAPVATPNPQADHQGDPGTRSEERRCRERVGVSVSAHG